jgi:four helix bundle protein
MDELTFKRRTKQLALATIDLTSKLPQGRASDVLARQLLRSGTSVGANYRAACRSRSTADMVSKLGLVEEEADETSYWLELIQDAGLALPTAVEPLLNESNEILAMTVASIRTLKAKVQSAKPCP